jgi:hypothetical protein
MFFSLLLTLAPLKMIYIRPFLGLETILFPFPTWKCYTINTLNGPSFRRYFARNIR